MDYLVWAYLIIAAVVLGAIFFFGKSPPPKPAEDGNKENKPTAWSSEEEFDATHGARNMPYFLSDDDRNDLGRTRTR